MWFPNSYRSLLQITAHHSSHPVFVGRSFLVYYYADIRLLSILQGGKEERSLIGMMKVSLSLVRDDDDIFLIVRQCHSMIEQLYANPCFVTCPRMCLVLEYWSLSSCSTQSLSLSVSQCVNVCKTIAYHQCTLSFRKERLNNRRPPRRRIRST